VRLCEASSSSWSVVPDQELLLSTISATDLDRKDSDSWDKEYPKCTFYGKAYSHRTSTVQCHMTSQVTVSGKHKRETAVCIMESTKDDSSLKTRFFAVRKEIYNHYKEKQTTGSKQNGENGSSSTSELVQ
jgi:hypothetical protein